MEPHGQEPVAPTVRRLVADRFSSDTSPKHSAPARPRTGGQSSFAKASEDTRIPPRPGETGLLRRRVKNIPTILLLIAGLPFTAEATTLESKEARELCEGVGKSERQPGSYRFQTVKKTKNGSTTKTILTTRTKEGKTFSRDESVTTVDGHPQETQTRVKLKNEEGEWRLFGRRALFFPQFTIDMEQAGQLTNHMQFAGERFETGGRPFARVFTDVDEKGRELLEELMDEQLEKLKKDVPFAMRILFGTALAMNGGVGAFMPVRQEYLIDLGTTNVIESWSYNAKKKLLDHQTATERTRIADLPPETFKVPAGFEILRPKNMVEAFRLEGKLRDEEREAKEKKEEDEESED